MQDKQLLGHTQGKSFLYYKKNTCIYQFFVVFLYCDVQLTTIIMTLQGAKNEVKKAIRLQAFREARGLKSHYNLPLATHHAAADKLETIEDVDKFDAWYKKISGGLVKWWTLKYNKKIANIVNARGVHTVKAEDIVIDPLDVRSPWTNVPMDYPDGTMVYCISTGEYYTVHGTYLVRYDSGMIVEYNKNTGK